MSNLSRTFGNTSTTPEERRQNIRNVFEKVAPRYDLMNDLMSFGIHRLWKRSLVNAADISPGQCIVDLAGGTGDVAKLIAGNDRLTIVCDPSVSMMHAGRTPSNNEIQWLGGEGEALPFADGSADTVTIAFGIRNVTHIETALAEIFRILKPEGRYLCLEFSKVWAPVRPFYDLFSRTVIPRLGAWVAKEPSAYTYLIESIRRFPDQKELKSIMEQAGFSGVRYKNYSMGIACLHIGTKPADAST